MASEFDTISTQITKPSPVIEGSLSNFLPFIDMLSKGAVDSSFSGINTANYDPKVAAQTALQTGAASNAAGLGSLVGTRSGDRSGFNSILHVTLPTHKLWMHHLQSLTEMLHATKCRYKR